MFGEGQWRKGLSEGRKRGSERCGELSASEKRGDRVWVRESESERKIERRGEMEGEGGLTGGAVVVGLGAMNRCVCICVCVCVCWWVGRWVVVGVGVGV